nr:L10-interacting MYB domain-containing protein-like [Tanacetum cinerariifolium]
MGTCIAKLDKVGWAAQDPMYDTALLLFGQCANYRKLWLHLKPESCGNWVKSVASNKGSGQALSISKMKVARYPDFGLELLEPEHMWINEVCTYDINAFYGISHCWFNRQKFYIDQHIADSSRKVKDFQLGIESYQKQLNLNKLGWNAKGFEYKHDYIIIDSPRVVVFPVGNNKGKIMRFNEIYKFSDGTLTNIMEAPKFRVKEYKVNRLNPGMNTRF